MSALHQAVPDVQLMATSAQGTTGLLSVKCQTFTSLTSQRRRLCLSSHGAPCRGHGASAPLALWLSARHLSFFICRQGNLMSTLLGLDEASWLGPGEQDMA